MLGYRMRRIGRHPGHGEPERLGGGKIDVVETGATKRDEPCAGMAKPFPLWRARRLRHLQPLSEHRLANLHFDRGRSHPGAFSVGDRDFIGVGAARQHVPPIELLIEHDVAMVMALCDDVYVLDRGRVIAHGPTRDVLTSSNIRMLYGVDAEVGFHPRAGHLTVVPVGRAD